MDLTWPILISAGRWDIPHASIGCPRNGHLSVILEIRTNRMYNRSGAPNSANACFSLPFACSTRSWTLWRAGEKTISGTDLSESTSAGTRLCASTSALIAVESVLKSNRLHLPSEIAGSVVELSGFRRSDRGELEILRLTRSLRWWSGALGE